MPFKEEHLLREEVPEAADPDAPGTSVPEPAVTDNVGKTVSVASTEFVNDPAELEGEGVRVGVGDAGLLR